MDFLKPFVDRALRTYPVYDDKRRAYSVEEVLARKCYILTLKQSADLYNQVLKLVRKHISEAKFAAKSAAEFSRALVVADAKKTPYTRLKAYADLLPFAPMLQLEAVPKMAVEGHTLESAVHTVVAPKLRKPLACAHCDMTYNSLTLCRKCEATLTVIKKKVPKWKYLFKSELSALRYYDGRANHDLNNFVKLCLSKKPWKPIPEQEIVEDQPYRDYDMSQFKPTNNRKKERMEEYNLRKEEQMREFMAQSEKIAREIQEKMEKEVKPQEFDIQSIWDGIKSIVNNMIEKGYLTVAILAIVGACLTALILWIWTSTKADLLLQILITCVSGLVILGVMGPLLKKIVDIWKEAQAVKEDKKKKIVEEKKKLDAFGEAVSVATSKFVEVEKTALEVQISDSYDEAVFRAFIDTKDGFPLNLREADNQVYTIMALRNRSHPGWEAVKPIPWIEILHDYQAGKSLAGLANRVMYRKDDAAMKMQKQEAEKPVADVVVQPPEATPKPMATAPSIINEDIDDEEEEVVDPPPGLEDSDDEGSDSAAELIRLANHMTPLKDSDPISTLHSYCLRHKLELNYRYETVTVDRRPVYYGYLTVGEVPFASGHYHASKKDAKRAVSIAALQVIGSIAFENRKPVAVTPQGGEDDSVDVFEQMLKGTAEEMVKYEKSDFSWAKSTISYLHSTATTLRDFKSIAEIVQPFVETSIGAYYELITGTVWVPWSQKGFADELIPVLEEHTKFATDAHRASKLHANVAYQDRVKKHAAVVEKLEEKLTRMRVPPRYLTQLVHARHECVQWVADITASQLVGHDRVEPVGVMMLGLPGTGKSTAMAHLIRDIHPGVAALYPEVDAQWNDGMIYPKKVNTKNDFDDGYKGQPYTTCDDFLQSDDVELRRAEVLWTISAVNRAPMKLNMAALPDKAGTYFRSVLVGITRNGNARPPNLGITDYMAFARRFPLVYCATPEKGVFNRLDITGKVIETGLTRKDMARQTLALIVKHKKATSNEIEPIEIDMSPDDLNALGESLKDAHDKDVRTKKVSPEPKAPQKKKFGGAQHVRPQGNVIGGPTLDGTINLVEELEELGIHVDQPQPDSPSLDTIRERARDILEKIGEKVPEEPGDLYAAIQRSIAVYKDWCIEKLSSVKNWTIAQWDKVMSWMSSVTNSLSVRFWTDVFKAGLKGAMSAMTKWVTDTVAGKVVAALSVAALAAAVVAGIVMSVKHFVFPDVDPQSRTEKEKAHDREVVKENLPQEAKLVNGRLVVDGGDAVMMGHHGPRVFGQVLENELPLIEAYSNNVWLISYEMENGKTAYGNITFFAGRQAVSVRHVFQSPDGRMKMKPGGRVTLKQVHNKAGDNIVRTLPNPKVEFEGGSEVAWIEFDLSMPPAQSLMNHFFTDAEASPLLKYGIERPKVIYRLPNGERQISEGIGTARAEFVHHPVNGFAQTGSDVFIKFNSETPDGSSGGLVITTSNFSAKHILGVHAGNSLITSYDILVTAERIKARMQATGSAVIAPQLKVVQTPVELPKNQVQPVGLLENGHASAGKNRITPSPLAEHLMTHPDPEMRLQPTSLPTVMYKTTAGEVYEKWKERGMYTGPPPQDPNKILDPMKTAYGTDPPFHHISEKDMRAIYTPKLLPNIEGGRYFILSPEDAVFGNTHLGIKPIDLTTSAGFNHAGAADWSRYAIFGVDRNNPTRTDFETWDIALQKAIIEILAALAKGDYPLGLMVDALKAENRGVSRVFNGETRLFYAGALAWLIVSRMFRAHLTAIEKLTPTISVPAVGITPTSAEWGELWKRLREQPNLIVVDAIQYDKHNQYMISRTIGEWHGSHVADQRVDYTGLSKVWKLADGGPIDKQLLTHIFEAIYCSSCDAVHVSGNVAYRDSQVMGSGADRTSQDNSYRGEVTARLAFMHIWKTKKLFERPEFKHKVPIYVYEALIRTGFYGDDGALTVNDLLKKDFNTYEYAKAVKEMTGTVLTLPSKEPIPADYTFATWEEAELLKRADVIREGRHYAPLQKKVIEDSLFWCGRADRRAAIARDTVRSVLFEAALHGEAYYKRMFTICERACRLGKVDFSPLPYDAVYELHSH